jgi:hypothetical protein
MPIYSPATPDKQKILMRAIDYDVDITLWTSYSFSSNFLTPADGWSMTIGGDKLAPEQVETFRPGEHVRLFVDNYALGDGRIDRVEISANRSSGVVYSIHGRDRLGPVVDSIADPRTVFKTGVTLAEFLKQLLKPYGWGNDDDFEIDNRANRDAKTGGSRGTPLAKRKSKTGKLSEFQIHQLKPHDHEGLYRFIARVVERFGLFVRLSADGSKVIVAPPDFDQEPKYQLVRRRGENNILSGTVVYDSTDQPSIIIADGFSNNAEFGRGQLKALCVNPYFGFDDDNNELPEVARLLTEYKDAQRLGFAVYPFKRRAPIFPPKPMFLHDEESKTQEQLAWFVKRTMSELLRKSMVCHYEVEGHGQNVDGVFVPWDVDTVVDVQDEVGGVNERMYVLGRTFEKSRTAGTTTKLELIRLKSIAVPEPPSEKKPTGGGSGTGDKPPRYEAPLLQEENTGVPYEQRQFKKLRDAFAKKGKKK